LNNEDKVCSLIDPLTSRWKTNVLGEYFDPVEVEMISRLIPSPLLREDRLIWRGTKHGVFTVRNAYYLELERRLANKGECSRKLDIQSFWKFLWNLPLPSVVKNFVWKVCNDILPTKVSLLQRKVVEDPFCPFCLIHPETPSHLLWTCPSSVALWQESTRKIQKLTLEEDDSFGFIRELSEKLDVKSFGEVLITMWFLWLRRNSFVFDRGCTTKKGATGRVSTVAVTVDTRPIDHV